MEFLQTEWGWTVILDLFFGGMGAAALAVSGVIRLCTRNKLHATVCCGAWIATGCLAAGVLCLLADVGQPLRAMLLPVSFSHATSWMTFGAWFMLCGVVFALLLALSETRRLTKRLGSTGGQGRDAAHGGSEASHQSAAPGAAYDAAAAHTAQPAWLEPAQMVFAVGGVLFGCAVTVYTGFLLSSTAFIPFWNTALLPCTFVTLSFLAGCTAVHLALETQERGNDAAAPCALALRVGIMACAVASGVALWLFLSQGFIAGEGAAQAASAVVGGAWAVVFWLCVAVIGVAAPAAGALVQTITHGRCWKVATGMLCAAVIGGIAWRVIVIALGAHAALYSPAAPQMFQGVTFLLG